MCRDTNNYFQAFSSGTVTTCFYDLGLSRLGFEHPTYRMRGERSHRGGESNIEIVHLILP